MITLILALLLALTTAAFALQNTDVVSIQFLLWEYQTSLVLVILGSAGAGFLLTLLISLTHKWKGSRIIRSHRATIQSQDQRIRELEDTLRQAREVLPPPASE